MQVYICISTMTMETRSLGQWSWTEDPILVVPKFYMGISQGMRKEGDASLFSPIGNFIAKFFG
jgi:hypothetical protein